MDVRSLLCFLCWWWWHLWRIGALVSESLILEKCSLKDRCQILIPSWLVFSTRGRLFGYIEDKIRSSHLRKAQVSSHYRVIYLGGDGGVFQMLFFSSSRQRCKGFFTLTFKWTSYSSAHYIVNVHGGWTDWNLSVFLKLDSWNFIKMVQQTIWCLYLMRMVSIILSFFHD